MSEPALLERDGELRAIEAALDAAAAGRGGLVLIEGPAGIGKSALVARARAAAVERNIAVAHARGSELERADPFGVVRQLLEPRLRAMTAAERERALEGAAGFKADRLDAASRMTEAAVTRARRNGSPGGFAIASAWRAWIALRRGDGEAAEVHARAAVDGAPADAWQHGFAVAALAEVLAERAEFDEARRLLGDGPYPVDRGSDLLISTRSIVRAASGDAAGALADQLEARGRYGEGVPIDPDFDGWLRLARLLHASGDEEGARHELDAALAWARTWGTPAYLGQALTARGLLEGGEAGIATLLAAVEQLERSPARRELARSLVELGGALRRSGRRVEALEPLRRALDLAAAGGLVLTAERAREELRATGARVHRDHATGVASLTPSERRIAERAAGGASNAEIAQALFVTVKTVEMHLSRAYRRLDIESRAGLGTLLKEQGQMTG